MVIGNGTLDRSHTSLWRSIVTTVLSYFVSEISEILVENCDFFHTPAFDAPVRGVLV